MTLQFSVRYAPPMFATMALLLLFTSLGAHAQQAPGAGGYNSEFGTDYRVGMAQRAAARQPIFVLGIRSHTTRGAQQNWIAPRFAAALSRQMQSLLGVSAPLPVVAKALSQNGLRAQNIGAAAVEAATRNRVAAPSTALPLRRTMVSLRREYLSRSAVRTTARKGAAQLVSADATAPLLALGGDITLSGPLQSPSTKITVALRVVRLDAEAMKVKPITSVTLRAPSRDWAQLPARCALALSDAMPFVLSTDERTALLRAASPLMPAASPARLQYEERVGNTVLQAMDAQNLWAAAMRETLPARRARSARQARDAAARATRELRVLATASPQLSAVESAVQRAIQNDARVWLLEMEKLSR